MYRETAKNAKNWSWQLATIAWYTCTVFYTCVYSTIVSILSVYYLYVPHIFQSSIFNYIYINIYYISWKDIVSPTCRRHDQIGTPTSWHLRCVPPLQHTSPCHGRCNPQGIAALICFEDKETLALREVLSNGFLLKKILKIEEFGGFFSSRSLVANPIWP